MTNTLRVGDIGSVIRLTIKENGTAVNLSTATAKKIKLKKPDASWMSLTAAFTTDGTDGKIQYTTAANDLDKAGVWSAQGYIEVSANRWHTDIVEFTVDANLV